MIRFVSSVLALGLVAVLPAVADEGHWIRFRGPNGGGISNAKTVPVRWTEQDYNWQIELPGPGHSSPVVWGKRIFITSGVPATALRTLLCVDADTGHTLWKREDPSKTYSQHRDNCYATATPAVDADDGVVSCLRVATGEVIWRERAGGAYYASPVWIDSRLYNVSRAGEVVVLAAADKFEILGRVPLGEPTFATPAVADGVMYLRTSTHLFSLGGRR